MDYKGNPQSKMDDNSGYHYLGNLHISIYHIDIPMGYPIIHLDPLCWLRLLVE